MGTQVSRDSYQSQSNLKSHLTVTTESELILYTKVEYIPKPCWYRYLCCCVEVEIEERQIAWKTQTLELLQRKYRQFPWRRNIQRALVEFSNSKQLEQIQPYMIADIYKIIVEFEMDVMTSTLQSLPHQDEEHREKANSLLDDKTSKRKEKTFYRQVMQAIEDHLNQSQSPLGEMYFQFLNVYCQLSISTINQIRHSIRINRRKQQEVHNIEICDQLKAFIDFFIQTIFSFYMLDNLLQDKPNYLKCFTFANLSSFALTILFQDDKLYSKVVATFQDVYYDENMEYFKQVMLLYEEPIGFYGVPDLFQLSDYDSGVASSVGPVSSNPSVQKSSMEIKPNIPYQDAIEILQKIITKRSPTHQLRIISKTVDQISICIDNYCDKYQSKMVKAFGADELVPILMYIVVKSQIEDLGIYLKMIETFSPRNSLNSAAGYKLVTLQNCYRIIQTYNINEPKRPLQRLTSKSYAYQINYKSEETRPRSVNMEY